MKFPLDQVADVAGAGYRNADSKPSMIKPRMMLCDESITNPVPVPVLLPFTMIALLRIIPDQSVCRVRTDEI